MNREAETRVLLAAVTPRDGEITCGLLAAQDLACVFCPSLAALIAELERGVGSLLLTDDVFADPSLGALVGRLESQPSWSDVPVVILMQGERDSPMAARALATLRNVTVVERPAPTRSVVSAVQAAVRGRLRQYQIREQIEAIQSGQAQFEKLANFIPHLAWMARPDGWVFWYNRRWHEYTGKTAAEMEGWGWKSVHEPGMLGEVQRKWHHSLASGEPFDMTFPLRGADGRFRQFWTQVMPFRDERGRITFWFGTNTDVSEQRQLQQEREELLASERAARTAAEQAGRLKDEFLATLSHELRTPLNAILGWAQLLRREHAGDPDLDEGLSVIERNARVQAELIEDLLDMSRITSGKLRLTLEPVDLLAITQQAMESVQPAAQARDIRLKMPVIPPRVKVRGDSARLQQVLWNLLSNAIKFTPSGGRVEVAIAEMNNRIEIRVTDTGAGIPPEFLPYVFERFRQADASTTRKHGGLGLGLAIVKQLVELHGGKVSAHSAGEGKGATFIVELPAFSAQTAHLKTALDGSGSASPVSLGNGDALAGVCVLVVDDEDDARRLVVRVLTECKARVVAAASAAEAFDAVLRDHPSVIVSDIGMPQEDGYAFIRRVRRLPQVDGGQTPAVALTAFARPEDRARALTAGYQAHLVKPVEPNELVAAVSLMARTHAQPSA